MNPATRPASILALLALGALTLHASPLRAEADPEPISYSLEEQATFEAGCLPPCMCPVLVRASLSGTFTLVPGAFDGAFQHYEVREVSWRLSGSATGQITGKGAYQVGGEQGDQQRLTLDLSVDGAPEQRYDSGLVSGGGVFPRLDLPVALNGFYCHDRVYGVQAQPQAAGVIRTPEKEVALRATPNPFGAATRIEFAVASAGPVELRIYDVTGRSVRVLLEGQRFEPGRHAVTWDGRRDDGADAPAGVYFVGLSAGGREIRGRLVRF
jgi:hypothetical protein